MNYDNMTKQELIDLLVRYETDAAYGIMTRGCAELKYSSIDSGDILIFVDIANMHAANNMYSNAGIDSRIREVFSHFRNDDIVIRWGGDEIVIIIRNKTAGSYIARLDSIMHENDLYAYYSVVNTSNNLLETINRADVMINVMKQYLKEKGMIDRSKVYVKRNSMLVAE